jgi:hypothetical protein
MLVWIYGQYILLHGIEGAESGQLEDQNDIFCRKFQL